MGCRVAAARGAVGMTPHDRAVATAAVVAKFRARPFGWARPATCIHLARAQMRALGHRPPPLPRFTSPIGATRALRDAGFADLAGLLDSMLPRITPGGMWVGDLALMEGDGTFDAIVVSQEWGARMVAGYHGDHLDEGVVNIEGHAFKAAWRL